MKSLLSIPLFLLVISFASAQAPADTMGQKIDSLGEGLETLQSRLPELPENLKPQYQELDSVRSQFNAEAASLISDYQNSLAKIDAETGKINTAVDSLQRLQLPANKYRPKLDSLQQQRNKVTAKFTFKVDALKSVTTEKLKSLDLPPQYNEPLQQLISKVDGFNLNSDFVKIPQLEVPGF